MKNFVESETRRYEQLLSKHPELKDVTVEWMDTAGISYQELHEFIELCWQASYDDQFRPRFTAEEIEYMTGDADLPQGVLVKDASGQLVGLSFLCVYPYWDIDKQQTRKYIIGTGLSTHPDWRGKGMAQFVTNRLKLLYAYDDNSAEAMISYTWIDRRMAKKAGSSHTVFTKKTETYLDDFSACIKVSKVKELLSYGELSFFEGLVIRAMSWLSFKQKESEFDGLSVKAINDTSDFVKLSAFIQQQQSDAQSLQRIFEPEFLKKQCCFSKNNFSAAGYYLEDEHGNITGIIWGWPQQVYPEHDAFFWDDYYFANQLTEKHIKKFFAFVEHDLNTKNKRIISFNVNTNTFPYKPTRFGYLPFVSLHLTQFDFGEQLASSQQSLELRVPLR